jgi:hypothetical protein
MEVISPVQRSAALNRGMFSGLPFPSAKVAVVAVGAQGPAVVILPTRARVQAHRFSSLLALHEGGSHEVDHHSSGCLPAEKFPTCASGRQGRDQQLF